MMLMRGLLFIFPIFIGWGAWSGIPNMRVSFDTQLSQNCGFVDDTQVIASLEASLKVLNEIEEKRDECQSLHINSKAFLDSYLTHMRDRDEKLQQAIIEEQVIRSEIERLTLAGTYTTQYDSGLLEVMKTRSLYSDKKKQKADALMQSFELSSTLLEDLQKKPNCADSVGSHVIAPSIGILGQLSGAFYKGSNAYTIPLVSGFAQLISRLVAYVSRSGEASYVNLKEMNQASNYYLSYKCAFKNIEQVTCSLLEEEHMMGKLHLPTFGQKILDLDEDGRFKELRDLKRHSYRVFYLIEELNRIFNSPETFDALKEVVVLQSIFAKLDVEPKNPPLKNKYYIEALKEEGYSVDDSVGVWSSFDLGQIKWSTWYHRHFLSSNYLGKEVSNRCNQSSKWGINQSSCRAGSLSQVSEMNAFIKEIIVPSLISTLKEQERLNVQIQAFPSIESLYTLLDSQETYRGDPDTHEYTLGELLDKFKSFSKFFLHSPLRLFAQDVLVITSSLKKLLYARNYTLALFLKEARSVYDDLAKISNNGRSGGVLYVSSVEGKFYNYFAAIDEYYLLQDQDVALKFSKFNVLADLYRKYQDRLVQPNYLGSSNLSLMTEVQASFIDVFMDPMKDHLEKIQQRYLRSDHKKEKRELVQSCALLYPYLDKEGDDYTSRRSSQSYDGGGVIDIFGGSQEPSGTSWGSESESDIALFCRDLLKGEGGIPILVQEKNRYSLKPEHRPNFQEPCYYYYYQREVSIKSISERFKSLNNSIRF